MVHHQFKHPISFSECVIDCALFLEFRNRDFQWRHGTLVAAVQPASQFYAISTVSNLERIQKNEGKLLNQGLKLCYHRGANKQLGNDVSIYYPGFQKFAENCIAIQIDKSDCEIAYLLCTLMAEVYLNESKRVDNLLSIFKSYIHNKCETAGSSTAAPDIYINDALLVEVKNEPGSTSSDPLREVVSYYIQRATSLKRPFPCFLVEVSGPNMMVSGAIFVDHVYVDMLVPPVWLVPQIKNYKAMVNVAKTLKALKVAVSDLLTYKSSDILHQLEYPSLQVFEYYEETIQIEYSGELSQKECSKEESLTRRK